MYGIVFACSLLWQSFDPHVVIQPYPNGTCVKIFETRSRVFNELGNKPRGNTQAVLVAAGFSGEPRDFYLGVVHVETNRVYLNYFYKMQVGDGLSYKQQASMYAPSTIMSSRYSIKIRCYVSPRYLQHLGLSQINN
jgi:hypothetical protein